MKIFCYKNILKKTSSFINFNKTLTFHFKASYKITEL